jgi:hypothetical protein
VLLRLGEEHADAEAAGVDETLLQPLKDGLPLTERVTVPSALADGEKDSDGVLDIWGLSDCTPLPVDNNEAVALEVLLRLREEHADAEAEEVSDEVLQPLNEGLPLIVTAIDGDDEALLENVDEETAEGDGELLSSEVGEKIVEELGEVEAAKEALKKSDEDADRVESRVLRGDIESQFAVADPAGENVVTALMLVASELEHVALTVTAEELVGERSAETETDVPDGEDVRALDSDGDADDESYALLRGEGVGDCVCCVESVGKALILVLPVDDAMLSEANAVAVSDGRVEVEVEGELFGESEFSAVSDGDIVLDGDGEACADADGDGEELPQSLLRADADGDIVASTEAVEDMLPLALSETENEPIDEGDMLDDAVSSIEFDGEGVLVGDAEARMETDGEIVGVLHALLGAEAEGSGEPLRDGLLQPLALGEAEVE